MQTEISIQADPARAAEAAAQRLTVALSAVQATGRAAHLALAGGTTPRELYRTLAEDPWRRAVDWAAVEIWLTDERCLPATDPQSNWHLVSETVLASLPVDAARVHRVHGELGPAGAAGHYDDEMRRLLPGRPPALDVVLLGMGADGHTASLFPGANETARIGQEAVLAEEGLATPAAGPPPWRERVTLTLALLNRTPEVIFLVLGAAKAGALRRVLDPKAEGPLLPAARVRPPNGRVTWVLDRAAATALPDALIGGLATASTIREASPASTAAPSEDADDRR